jgi:hypothetical protein
MRALTCFLLLAALPLQAKEQTEQEQLAWFNYQLAVAEAPGDLASDQSMAQMLDFIATLAPPAEGAAVSEPMQAYRARAQVVAAELEARVEAGRDSDPFLLVADLGCWPKTRDRAVCDQRRAKLEPFVAGNAFHGVVLMSYAWMREDADAFLRVARLAAAAEVYDSLPAMRYRSLVERYRKVPMPARPDMDALTRAYAAEVTAMSLSIGIAMPPYQNFSQPCRESEGDLRGYCLAIARKMMLQGQHMIEVGIAVPLVEALGTPDDIALARARQREMQWLQEKSLPLLTASAQVPVAGTEAFFDTYGSGGEIEALRALLRAHGIASLPPADWTKASPRPAGSP